MILKWESRVGDELLPVQICLPKDMFGYGNFQKKKLAILSTYKSYQGLL